MSARRIDEPASAGHGLGGVESTAGESLRDWGRTLFAAIVFLGIPLALGIQVARSGRGSALAGDGWAPPPSVVLIVLDGFRPELLEQYALRGTAMPHLRALSKEGLWFENHWAASDGTNAAFASLLTGLWPRHHGVGSLRLHGRERLPAEAQTIAEDLAGDGWRTYGSVALPQFDDRVSGFGQGFGVWNSPPPDFREPYLRAGLVLSAIKSAWVEGLRSEDAVFLLLHWADGRPPSNVPTALLARIAARHLEPFRDAMPELGAALSTVESDPVSAVAAVEQAIGRLRGHPAHEALIAAREEAEYAFIDTVLGEVLRTLREEDRYDGALIALAGNTGPSPRPEPGATPRTLDPQRLGVPLLLRLPSAVKARTITAPTSAVDLRPTLLDTLRRNEPGRLSAMETASRSDGVSLLPLLDPIEHEERKHANLLIVDDSQLGRTAAIDEFWLVPDGNYDPPVWLEDGRAVTELSNVSEAAGTSLDEAHERLTALGRSQRITIALQPGEKGALRVEIRSGEALIDTVEASRGAKLDVAPELQRLRPRPGVSATFSAPDPYAREPRLDLSLDRCDGTLEFIVRAADGAPPATEDRIWVGDRPLAHLRLPRVADAEGPRWPRGGDGGLEPASVALDQESGPWWRLTVTSADPDGTSGLLVTLHPRPTGRDEELEVEVPAGVRIERPLGRPDVALITGTGSFQVRVKKRAETRFALSARVDGERVAPDKIRLGDRRFQREGVLHFLVPGWMPGISDTLEHDIAGRATAREVLPVGSLRILRTSSFGFPPDAARLAPGLLEFIDRLPSED